MLICIRSNIWRNNGHKAEGGEVSFDITIKTSGLRNGKRVTYEIAPISESSVWIRNQDGESMEIHSQTFWKAVDKLFTRLF